MCWQLYNRVLVWAIYCQKKKNGSHGNCVKKTICSELPGPSKTKSYFYLKLGVTQVFWMKRWSGCGTPILDFQTPSTYLQSIQMSAILLHEWTRNKTLLSRNDSGILLCSFADFLSIRNSRSDVNNWRNSQLAAFSWFLPAFTVKDQFQWICSALFLRKNKRKQETDHGRQQEI